ARFTGLLEDAARFTGLRLLDPPFTAGRIASIIGRRTRPLCGAGRWRKLYGASPPRFASGAAS
ncbi:MAG TPA: hypothetical protein VMS17_25635, partial [Gemmataceae bacterium]|nr:hypothetical protein [Gemmataceae bacterium]